MGRTISPEPPNGTVRLWLDRWGDFIVQSNPHPPGKRLNRIFAFYPDAIECADMLAKANEWQLVDEVAKAAA
jgi:hypothetical protein